MQCAELSDWGAEVPYLQNTHELEADPSSKTEMAVTLLSF